MKTKWVLRLVLGFVFAGNTGVTATGSQREAKGEQRSVTIHVYDYAHAKPRVLTEAKGAAATVLQKSGVEVMWVDCAGDDTPPSNSACSPSPDPTHLTLRILPESMSKHLRQLHGGCARLRDAGRAIQLQRMDSLRQGEGVLPGATAQFRASSGRRDCSRAWTPSHWRECPCRRRLDAWLLVKRGASGD